MMSTPTIVPTIVPMPPVSETPPSTHAEITSSEKPMELFGCPLVMREAMERTGTWDLRARSILELSGGERQRVVLARAFAQEPHVLLLEIFTDSGIGTMVMGER